MIYKGRNNYKENYARLLMGNKRDKKNKEIEKPEKILIESLKKMNEFKKVKFIILYGSYAYGKPSKLSDYDFCIYYEGNRNEQFKFRLKALSKLPDNFDVQIFQNLPLYVRKETLRGKLVYYKELTFVYDVAYETIKEFDEFKKYYLDYINTRRLAVWEKT